jgi:hypothetical protein
MLQYTVHPCTQLNITMKLCTTMHWVHTAEGGCPEWLGFPCLFFLKKKKSKIYIPVLNRSPAWSTKKVNQLSSKEIPITPNAIFPPGQIWHPSPKTNSFHNQWWPTIRAKRKWLVQHPHWRPHLGGVPQARSSQEPHSNQPTKPHEGQLGDLHSPHFPEETYEPEECCLQCNGYPRLSLSNLFLSCPVNGFWTGQRKNNSPNSLV